jgi:hypothetical protein
MNAPTATLGGADGRGISIPIKRDEQLFWGFSGCSFELQDESRLTANHPDLAVSWAIRQCPLLGIRGGCSNGRKGARSGRSACDPILAVRKAPGVA